MQKIIVIGCSGAGKSTFSRKLRDNLNLPLIHLDMVWHKPDKSNLSEEEFDKLLIEIMRQEKWIIDGTYSRTLEMRLQKCDTIFLLDFPLDVCLKGIAERVNKKREDLPWLETSLDEELVQNVMTFSQNKLLKIYALLKKYKKNKNIIVFKSREEANNYIERL